MIILLTLASEASERRLVLVDWAYLEVLLHAPNFVQPEHGNSRAAGDLTILIG